MAKDSGEGGCSEAADPRPRRGGGSSDGCAEPRGEIRGVRGAPTEWGSGTPTLLAWLSRG